MSMKNILLRQWLLIAVGAVPILWLAGCKTKPTAFPLSWLVTVEKGQLGYSVFEEKRGQIFGVPHDRVETMPPCKANLAMRAPCCAFLRTVDGKVFSIGAPDAPREVALFIGTLEKGYTYTFPDAFLEFQKRLAEDTRSEDQTKD